MKRSTLILWMLCICLSSITLADTVAVPATGLNQNTSTTVTTTMVVSDADITSALQKKIAEDTSLSGTVIKISTHNAVVTLDGTVITQAQADTAIQLAKLIPGVQNVQSNLVVTSNTDTTNTTTTTTTTTY